MYNLSTFYITSLLCYNTVIYLARETFQIAELLKNYPLTCNLKTNKKSLIDIKATDKVNMMHQYQ